ncbi:MAG: hypothetical protein KDD70_14050 [Bdellovibrionales bacterium]|nr:hypothetical protein [Bdellovibrionales bacterium]
MSTIRQLLLIPLPLLSLLTPPIFLVPITFTEYFQQLSYSLVFLGIWVVCLGIGRVVLPRIGEDSPRRVTGYFLLMLLLGLAIALMSTSGEYVPKLGQRWLLVSILATLPLVFLSSQQIPIFGQMTIWLISFTAVSFSQFPLVLDIMRPQNVAFVLLFSISTASIAAQVPFFSAEHLTPKEGKLPKRLLQLHSVLWGLIPACCLVSIGNHWLPPSFLIVLIGLLPLVRLLNVLHSLSDEGLLSEEVFRRYQWWGTISLCFLVLLVVVSALLSYAIAHDNLLS